MKVNYQFFNTKVKYMKKNILLLAVAGLLMITSCAKHELAEERLTDEKAIELSTAVLTAIQDTFMDGISKMKPGDGYYDGTDFTIARYTNDYYKITFDDCALIVAGKPVFIKEGEAEFVLKDISLFTGNFNIGECEIVYDKLERDFEWVFSYDGVKYDGKIEIEDNSYDCMSKVFPLKKGIIQ